MKIRFGLLIVCYVLLSVLGAIFGTSYASNGDSTDTLPSSLKTWKGLLQELLYSFLNIQGLSDLVEFTVSMTDRTSTESKTHHHRYHLRSREPDNATSMFDSSTLRRMLQNGDAPKTAAVFPPRVSNQAAPQQHRHHQFPHNNHRSFSDHQTENVMREIKSANNNRPPAIHSEPAGSNNKQQQEAPLSSPPPPLLPSLPVIVGVDAATSNNNGQQQDFNPVKQTVAVSQEPRSSSQQQQQQQSQEKQLNLIKQAAHNNAIQHAPSQHPPCLQQSQPHHPPVKHVATTAATHHNPPPRQPKGGPQPVAGQGPGIFVDGKHTLFQDRSVSSIPNTNLSSSTLTAIEKEEDKEEKDYFPFFSKKDRIAILLTGQLRAANRTWCSGTLTREDYTFDVLKNITNVEDQTPRDIFANGCTPRSSSLTGPETTAGTIIERLFKPLAKQHGVDVFMYQTAQIGYNNHDWDKNKPEDYEPMIGDMQGCQVFSQNKVFAQSTGNHFFCLVEPEVELLNSFLESSPIWTVYHFRVNRQRNEQALQQLYAIYRANQAAQQYASSAGVEYKYKIRLRPDTAFIEPFPDIDTLDFTGHKLTNSEGTIYYPGRGFLYNGGNEDGFNVGVAKHMDALLDRYIDFTTKPVYRSRNKRDFTMEDYLEYNMAMRYNVTLVGHPDINMVVVRVKSHDARKNKQPPPNNNPWRDVAAMNQAPVVLGNFSIGF